MKIKLFIIITLAIAISAFGQTGRKYQVATVGNLQLG